MNALQKYKILQAFLEQQTQLTAIAAEYDIPVRTLRRWAKQYRAQGLNGLERKVRADKNKRRSMDEELVALVEAYALQRPPLSITTIHRKISKIAAYQARSAPSYAVVYDLIRKIDPALLTLSHEGAVAYRNKYELIFRRESATANALWQMDHCLLDILVVNEAGQPQKPWLTIVIDDYSRSVCGFYLTFDHPCAVNTALALRQAIWKKANAHWQVCGIPTILYTDNGSDFIAEHIEQVCANLKIQIIHSIPGRPQGKGRVERFFLTLLQGMLEDLPGYTPGGSTPTATLTLEELADLVETFIIEQYHHTIHTTTQQAPLQRWLGNGFLPQLPDTLEQLDLLLLTVSKLRKVHRDGIYFKGLRYLSTVLSGFVGEQVAIRYDPRDMAEIRVFWQGQFLCRAICQEIADQLISLKDIKKARQQTKRQLRKTIQEAKQLLNPTTQKAISKVPSKKATSTLKLYRND